MSRREVYVGKNGELYSSVAEARKYGSEPAKKHPDRIPIDVDEKGNIRRIVYVGKNGELYSSVAEARKYGSKPSKRDPDRIPVRVTEEGKLAKKFLGIIAIIGVGISIFFLSSNITGNAIANLSSEATLNLGGILFGVGLVAGFIWLETKKK